MRGKLLNWEGTYADFGQLDDAGKAFADVEGGPHDGHKVTIITEKHNCDACGWRIRCTCGARWQSSMNGCWQQGHQRKEEGDQMLKLLIFHSVVPAK